MKLYTIVAIIITIFMLVSIYFIINMLYIKSKKRYLKEIDNIELLRSSWTVNVFGKQAPQGVAVSDKYVFIIYSRAIEKYDKNTKKL